MFIVYWLREAILLVIYIAAGAVGYFIALGRAEIPKNPNGINIVFVHGWLTQNPLYYFFKKHLKQQGFIVHMTSFGLHAGDIRDTAAQLDNYLRTNNLSNAVLVGTSVGALISWYYLEHLQGWLRVDKFIAIGGPFKGSPWAPLGSFTKAGRQMIEGSVFLQDIRQTGITHPERSLCLRARSDELVPAVSSSLEGVRTETINVMGHVMVQAFAKETFRAISEFASEKLPALQN